VNPHYLSDELFFDGNALPVNANLAGGRKATLSFTTLSSDNDLAFNWQWSAAVYTEWLGNNQVGILPYHHTDDAGGAAPEVELVRARIRRHWLRSVAPGLFERSVGERRIANGVRDAPVPEPQLNAPGIVPSLHQSA